MKFKQSLGDHTLFVKRSKEEKITALIVYVDDIIVTRDDAEEIKKLKDHFSKEFKLRDLGKLK